MRCVKRCNGSLTQFQKMTATGFLGWKVTLSKCAKIGERFNRELTRRGNSRRGLGGSRAKQLNKWIDWLRSRPSPRILKRVNGSGLSVRKTYLWNLLSPTYCSMNWL